MLTSPPALSQPAAGAPATGPVRPQGLPLVFKSGAGEARGTGTLTPGPTGVLVRLELTGLTPGWHAVHFHSVADCSDAALQKAGAHVQHMGPKAAHGLLNPDGPDAGDLPNVWADSRGRRPRRGLLRAGGNRAGQRARQPARHGRLDPDRARQSR